jgi:hypothetical protein
MESSRKKIKAYYPQSDEDLLDMKNIPYKLLVGS